MDDSVWELYKPELHRLYIQQNKILSYVREYMASMYGFDETTAQYTKHFRKWGFQKNQKLSEQEGIFIGKRMDKRKREFEKKSEVHINGIEYAPRKLQKAIYGKAYVPTMQSHGFPGAPSPDTPEGIVVCTPATPSMQLDWNLALPWLRFSKLLRTEQTEVSSPAQQPSPTSTLAVASPREPNAISHTVKYQVVDRLRYLVPWDRLSHPIGVNSSSRTATGLRILMPEESEGQLHALAMRFSESKQSTTDSLGLEMFLLSNNLVSHGPDGKTFDSMRSHDKRVMEILRVSGWNTVAQLQILLSAKEPTAGAIAEKIFASALRILDEDVVEMMLEAGMSPDGCIDTVDNGSLTPLQFLATLGGIYTELIEVFISRGADLNKSYNDISALEYAVDFDNTVVIEVLLSRGARVTPSCLAAAARNIQDLSRFQRFLGPDTDVNERSGWQGPSPLAQAVSSGSIEIINLLLTRGADVNAFHEIDFNHDVGFTTVLGIAVQSGKLEIIEALLHACPDVNPEIEDGLPYVSPLAIAASTAKGWPGAVTLLLQAGVDISIADGCSERTLLELASRNTKNIGVFELLVGYGAMIDRPLSEKEHATSALLSAVKAGATELVSLLISMGARLNDVYSTPPGTALGAAIEKGDLDLIQMLQVAGAVSISPKLRRITNLETAEYLDEIGLLQGILDISGAEILKAALLAKDNNLAQRLLYRIVEFNTLGAEATDYNGRISQKTPLQTAITTKRLPVAYTILERGATVVDCDLAVAVQYTVKYNDTELLRRLLTRFQGSAPTAMAEAILSDRPDLLQLLLAAGLDATGQPQKFRCQSEVSEDSDIYFDPPESVLEILSQSNNRPMLETILHSCPWSPSLVGRALTLSIISSHIELATYLLSWHVDVNQEITIYHPEVEDEDGKPIPGYKIVVTPLQIAVRDQHVHVVEQMLGTHPAIDINYLGAGENRRTALQHAVENGNMELVNLLLHHGANINSTPARDGGATALQIASIRGYLGIARRLIELGAEINAAPARVNGRTALEGAAEHGRIDMIQMLLLGGASVTGDDGQRQYRRAIEFAERNGHNAAARLLISFEPRQEEMGPDSGDGVDGIKSADWGC
ncbi:uncharacterized protein APUU_40067A [Aspergillus puulaauensis]|uniref:Clr5 domain-containing protein n=1 Tax=Aspergillus puulaauensis TaxID=1220207 RepID=A0A7R7XME1_9EURO|nr:uncharacterized protein APUU_40067A [Aspergillus puulaauensis]BCS23623.1 hypothetical protein APUU_40067A [Aspergillus puulaauensis]